MANSFVNAESLLAVVFSLALCAIVGLVFMGNLPGATLLGGALLTTSTPLTAAIKRGKAKEGERSGGTNKTEPKRHKRRSRGKR